MSTTIHSFDDAQEQWLTRYYFARALFSLIWVAAAFSIGLKDAAIAGVLLVIYPAWDACANWADGAASGGLSRNRTQRINLWVSGLTALAVALALGSGMNAVIGVIGAWAIVSGLLQLGTAVRRWKTLGAQWIMVLSGAQSALAGGFFFAQSRMATPPQIAKVAGYAAVGALYFLISGIWLTVRRVLRGKRQAS